MTTIVNLNIGEGQSAQVYTVDLVLANDYEEPDPRLLVLRSQPDVDPITGTLAVTEATDTASIEASLRLPIEPVIGTLSVTEWPDTASATGTTLSGAISGTWVTTEASDIATVTGDGFVGIGQRTGVMAATESPDIAAATAVYTPKWVATIAATEPSDQGFFSGAFIEYTGPGFLVTTEWSDTTSFIGSIVYDVAGTCLAQESPDIAAIIARSGEVVDAESTDTVIFSELLIGDVNADLVDRVYVTDTLDYSRDLAFTDTAIVSDGLMSGMRVSLVQAETLISTDWIGAIFSGTTVDVVTATDLLQGDNTSDVDDIVVVRELLTSSSVLSGLLQDQGVVSEQLVAVLAVTTTDTVTVTDALTGSLVYRAGLTDTVKATEVWTGALDVSLSRADILVSRDVLESAVLANTVDTVNMTDSIVGSALISAALADTGYATDSLLGEFTVYAPLLADQVVATDTLTSELVLVGILADTVWVTDSLHEATQTVYVVNAETGAVSTYQFTPVITGMAEYQGILYLSGPDGLYALDATQDEDGAIIWTLRTGFSNLGSDRLKRIQDVNIQARTEGDTTMQIIEDRYGEKQEWNYRLPARTRDSYRDGVTKVGKGINSVYFALGLQGVGPAEIDQLRVVVEPLYRRR